MSIFKTYCKRLLTTGLGLLVFCGNNRPAAGWSVTLNAQKEIWITPGSTGGTGTYADPFKVNSATDFDTLMVDALSAGVKNFRLTPGTFQTHGYNTYTTLSTPWSLPANSKFTGSGTDTILQRDTSWESSTHAVDYYGATVLAIDGSYVTVSDLKIDCNAVTNQFSYYLTSIAGVQGVGSGPFNYVNVERVLVEKPMGRYVDGSNNWECFSIGFGPPCIGTIVSSCVVSNFVVPGSGILYANGFSAQGNITYRDCRVYYPSSSSPDTMRMGFNIGGGNNQLIDRCYVENAGTAVYGDSFGMTNIIVQNSHFTNVSLGCYLNLTSGNPFDTVLFKGNVVDLPSSAPGGVYYHGFVVYNGTSGGRNLKITDNTFRFVADSGNSSSYAVSLVDTSGSLKNATVLNNTVDPALIPFSTWSAGSGATQSANSFYLLNRTLDGVINPLLNNDPTHPSKFHLITSSMDTIASDDGWVSVRLGSNSSFALPSTGVAGRTLTVYNEQGTGTATVTITAPGGGSIVPTSPTMGALQPNAFQRFIYNGSNTWQRN